MLFPDISNKILKKATLKAKNTKILHHLQTSLAKISGISTYDLSPLYQVIICGTIVVSYVC